MNMRIFDTYLYNIADKVSFGQTTPYLEQMLEELGYSYSRLGFSLHTVNHSEVFDKILQQFPTLEKYYYTEDFDGSDDPYLSSFSENWRSGAIHAEREDEDDIIALFSKIPRQYEIPFGTLILDGIDWFSDSDPSLAVQFRSKQGKHPTMTDPPFKSNRIMHLRDFDDGQRYNTIKVCVEATDDPVPRSTAEIVHKLRAYLGDPKWSGRCCVFPQEEQARFMQLSMEHTQRLCALADASLPKPVEHTSVSALAGQFFVHLMDKRMIRRAFAGTCFEVQKGSTNLENVLSCVDSHGFLHKVTVYRNPAFNEFQMELQISGCNFTISCTKNYGVAQESEAQNLLRAFSVFCTDMVNSYSDELAVAFGDTPEWYRKGI